MSTSNSPQSEELNPLCSSSSTTSSSSFISSTASSSSSLSPSASSSSSSSSSLTTITATTPDIDEEPFLTLPISSHPAGSISAELERLSALAVAAIHRQAFHDPALQRWSPRMKSTYEGATTDVGRDAMFAFFQAAARQKPREQRTEVLDVCADVDERRGRAKVWLTVVVRGLPGNLCKEGVTLLCWERRQEEWVCWRHHGMRGVEGYT